MNCAVVNVGSLVEFSRWKATKYEMSDLKNRPLIVIWELIVTSFSRTS